MKKLIAIVVAFFAAVPLMADTQSDWYASLSDKREPSTIYVGNERWRSWDTDKPLPYRFACGAILSSTAGGKRLDLTNVSVLNGSIQADGDLAILLYGDNYVSDGIFVNSGNTYYPLLIFGPGALTVRGAGGSGIMCGDLSICAGPFVTVIGGGISAGKTLVSMSSVAIHSPGSGLRGSNINILGAAVAIYSGTGSGSGVGMGGISTDNIVIDGSVVSIIDDGGWRGVWTQTLSVSHSVFSCVTYRDGWGCICADHAYFDNSIAKLYSKVSEPFNNSYVGDVTFGEGDYYIASGSQAYTIGANEVTIKGGNLQICSANAESSAVETEKFQIDAGRLEIVDKIDVREFLKYDAAAAAAFTGTLASGIDVTSLMANFYSQVILDAISNAKIGNLNGVPNVGIDCSGSSDAYIQNGGTVWGDLPKYGVMCYRPVVNGGSYKGQFYSPSYSRTVSGGHDTVSPVNSSGNALKCVSYAVAGAKKYDKITQAWSGVLPSYYGTGSLYADAAGKLYFWVPESWDVSGGGSGGGGYGGGDTPIPTKYWTVAFNANGGSVSEATRRVTNGTAIGTLPVPARDGYVFAGWFTAATGGTMISETTKVVADVTYYAHWTVSSGGSGGGTVDLAFYVPEHQGWTAPLIVSSDPFATAPQKVFEPGEPIYLNYAFNNTGDGTAVSNFVNRFTLSNGYYWDHSWVGYTVPENGWGWIGYNFMPEFLNNLPPGDYTLTCRLDANDDIAESSTANNSMAVSFRVRGADLKITAASVSKPSITLSESATAHWRVYNDGESSAVKTKTAFQIFKHDPAIDDWILKKTEWLDCNPLAAEAGREYTCTIAGKSLGVGEYIIRVWADGKEAVREKNESNNYSVVYLAVTKDGAVKSSSGVDWQFHKIKGEPDSFYLSTSATAKKKATVFKVGQTIYMRCCWWNATKKAASGDMRVRILLNGRPGYYADGSYFNKNSWYYFTDRMPSFLQNLPAGKYTLTAVLDSENNFVEKNEKNNVRTISFTVVGVPEIYGEATYTCALNESVNWPVSSEGSMSVKGLPKGMKYSGGVISGKASKTGTYTVKFTSKNAAGTRTKTIKIVVVNPGFYVSVNVRANGATGAASVAAGETVPMYVGVVQNIAVASAPGKSGIAKSGASSVKVSGLPPGLKYAKGVISGVPSKAGTYAVKLTFKNALGWSKTFVMTMKVTALPAFARGTFNGWSYCYDEGTEGKFVEKRKATISVTSVGKISATIGSLKFTGTGWTVDDDEFGWYRANLRTVRTVGSGKKAKKYTDVLWIWLDPDREWTGDQIGGRFASFNGTVSLADGLKTFYGDESAPVPLDEDIYVSVRRNPFGDNTDAKAIAAAIAAQGTRSYTDGSGLTWNLKVASNGVATISRATGSGKNKKTISATAVLEVEKGDSGYVRGVTRFLVSGKVVTVTWDLPR